MPNQTPLGIRPSLGARLGALASSLLLVTGFLAYRTGFLPSQNVVVLERNETPLNEDSTRGEVPLPDSEFEKQNVVALDNTLPQTGVKLLAMEDKFDTEGDREGVGARNEAKRSGQPRPLEMNADGKEASPNLVIGDGSESKASLVQTVSSTSSSSVTAPAMERPGQSTPVPGQRPQAPVPPKPPTFMGGSKSVVLLDAKKMKQQAKEALNSAERKSEPFKYYARESFSEQDRNRDGQLTKDELDDRVWARCLEHEVVKNNAVSFDGFLKLFAWYANQDKLEPPKTSEAVIAR